MTASHVLNSQQWGACADAAGADPYRRATGAARSLRPTTAMRLRVVCGQAWVTVDDGPHGWREDSGDLLLQARAIEKALAPALHFHRAVDAFRYKLGASGHGRDLTGYEDGTENPDGDEAVEAALVQGQGAGLDGSSFVAMQQWVHDMDAFEATSGTERDHIMGRNLQTNDELEDAPESAHVKRTEQESFTPEAFVLRRSMPWALGQKMGLMFVAFGHSLDAYEVQMRRMAGEEDGTIDGLFKISKPVTGSYLWCPPMQDGAPNLQQLGL